MMESKDTALTPSIVISPVDGIRKKGSSSVFTSLAISIKQSSTASHNGSETYEFKKTEVRHFSSSSEPSLTSAKTAESSKKSSAKTVGVIKDCPLDTNGGISSSTPPEDIAVVVEVQNGSEVADGTEVPSSNNAADGTKTPDISKSPDPEKPRSPEVEEPPPPSPPEVEVPSTSSRASVHVGLVNQAMTCYLNSLIQALFMTPEFRNALYKWEFTGSSEEEQHSIPYHLQKLFLNLQTSQRNAVETTKLTQSFGWDSSEAWHQHDIQELCRVMFEALERKFSNTEQADFIQRLYEGKMIDYVKCLQCCKEKSREDTFMDIPLPVKPFGNPVAYETIEEALDGFVQAETLDGNNQYFCETCNMKCDAQKGLKFSHFPYILTLHLKRFDFDYNTMHRIKLNDKVSFPEVLNLNGYIGEVSGDKQTRSDTNSDNVMSDLKSSCSTNGCSANGCSDASGNNSEMWSCPDSDEGIDEGTRSDARARTCPVQKHKVNCDTGSSGPFKYELFSIMIHSGSASGGHYFAYIKDFDTNEWFCFNDDVVSPISHEDIVENFCANNKNRGFGFTSTPYMLMYRQIDEDKNAMFIKADAFPDHIKKLVEVVQKEDEEQASRRTLRRRRRRDLETDSEKTERSQQRAEDDDRTCVRVHFEQDGCEKKVRWLMFSSDETLGDFINVAAEVFAITDVPIQKLRLAVCSLGEIPVVDEIKGQTTDLIKNFLPEHSVLSLYIEEDAPEEGVAAVQLVSLDSSELVGLPIELEYTKGMTVGQLKEKLIPYFVYTENPPQHKVFVVSNRVFNRNVFSDDKTVQQAKLQCSKFFAAYTEALDMDQPACQRRLAEILGTSVVEVKCKLVGISKKCLTRFGTNPWAIARTDWKKIAVASLTTNVQNGERDVTNPANCEKSLDDNDGSSSTPPLDLKSIARSAIKDQSLGASSTDDNATPLQNLLNRNEKENSSDTLFTVQRIDENNNELSLTVGSEMRVSIFKDMLSQFVGFPSEYIKLYNHPKDRKECALSSFPIGELPKRTLETLCVKILKPTSSGSTSYWKIHLLDPKLWTADHIFNCGLSKNMTVSQAKQIILQEMQERGFDAMPIERCRLRDIGGSRPRNVFLDEQTLRELYSSSYDILVQEREGPEPVTSTRQNLVLVQNFDLREEDLGKEIVLEGVSSFRSEEQPIPKDVTNFYEKLSSETGIPVDDLDVKILYLSSAWCRTWRRDNIDDSLSHINLIDSGHAFFYRDNRVPIEDPVTKDLWNEHVSVKEYLERKAKLELESTENSIEYGDSSAVRTSRSARKKMLNATQSESTVTTNGDFTDNALAQNPNFQRGAKSRDAGASADTHPPRARCTTATLAPQVWRHCDNGDIQSVNDTKQAESSEPAKETPKSYRSKERGLKIYVEPTPLKSNEQQSNGKAVPVIEESQK